MSTQTVYPAIRPHRAKPPSNRWRNVYWLARPVPLKDGPAHPGGSYGPGRFVSQHVWPSKEVAEERGLRSIALFDARHRPYIIYVGAEQA